MELRQAQQQVRNLQALLTKMLADDSDQEIGSIALKPLDTLLDEIKPHLGSNPLVASMRDVISPELIEEGGTVRVADLLVLLTQLGTAIGPPETIVVR